MGHEVNVQPGHGRAGRQPTREFLDTLSGHDDPGMFGRMFPTLEPLVADDGPLKELADAMKDPDPGSAAGNNVNVPAGFTYLGQFVDHDITLDLTSIGEKEADPQAVKNFPHAGAWISTRSTDWDRTAAASSTPAMPAMPMASRRVRSS